MAGAAHRIRTTRAKDRLSKRNSQIVGAVGFLGAAVLPLAMWHRALGAIASDFRLQLDYLITGWTSWGLMWIGLLFFIPVVLSIGRSPESRLYPRARNAYIGWGCALYVLGLALGTQVAQIADSYTTP